MEELFNDHRLHSADLTPIEGEIGSSVTKEEAMHAIKTMRNGKSTGQNEVSIDLLKCIDEEHINTIVELHNKIYLFECISRDNIHLPA